MTIRLVLIAFKKLEPEDFRVLNAIERGMAHGLYVQVEFISKLSGLPLEEVEVRLRKLNTLGLVQRRKGAFTGYTLTSRGYDCLALNALRKRGTLTHISSSPIGTGKESDVYMGLTPSGRRVTVKMHRVGRVSFRQARKVRVYVGDRRHVSWLYLSRLAAKTEYEALRLLYPEKIAVPEPVDWNRHIVVTGFIEGVELYKVPELPDPRSVMERIIDEVIKCYNRVGIVHGDLSEYNVLVTKNNDIVIFDWPQWVSKEHPSALILLKRDLENILAFFKRKYRVRVNVDEEVSRIVSELEGREHP